jgi:hypothetical protein
VTSTAFIDVAAGAGAAGIAEAPAGNSSVPQAVNAGASADFRSNWQEILKALAGAGQVEANQAPLSRLRETSLPSNAKAIAQQGSRSRSEGSSHEPRKGHAQKLAANTNSEVAAAAPLLLTPESPAIGLIEIPASVATPVDGAWLPASIKASSVVQAGFATAEGEPESTSAELMPAASTATNVSTDIAKPFSDLDLRTDSSSAPGHFADGGDGDKSVRARMPQALEENASDSEKLTGKEQFATARVGAAHVRFADSRPAQALAAHSAPTVDDPPVHEDGTTPRQSETGIVAATSVQVSHAEFAGAQKIAGASGAASTTPGAQQLSGAANATPLDSVAMAQAARGEGRPQRVSAGDPRDTSAPRLKQTATISGMAQAGVPSAARSVQASYSAHYQSQAGAADPLTAAAMTRSGSANELGARDEMQPQVSMGSAAHDPFAELDARTAAPAATWLQAGTHHAEAGYLDPSLGWVAVRAESSGSALHAAILPGSGEAAQALGGHLTALNSFMSEHHGRSSTVTLASPDQGQAQGGFNHSGGHSGEGEAQRQSHEGQAQGDAAPFTSTPATDTGTRAQARVHADAHVYEHDGVHISVIA